MLTSIKGSVLGEAIEEARSRSEEAEARRSQLRSRTRSGSAVAAAREPASSEKKEPVSLAGSTRAYTRPRAS